MQASSTSVGFEYVQIPIGVFQPYASGEEEVEEEGEHASSKEIETAPARLSFLFVRASSPPTSWKKCAKAVEMSSALCQSGE